MNLNLGVLRRKTMAPSGGWSQPPLLCAREPRESPAGRGREGVPEEGTSGRPPLPALGWHQATTGLHCPSPSLPSAAGWLPAALFPCLLSLLGTMAMSSPSSLGFRFHVLFLLHFLCSLCLDIGAKSEFEASLRSSFSPCCSHQGPGPWARHRQVCPGVVGEPELDKPSQEPLGLGAGRQLQRVGTRGTVGGWFPQ